MNIQLRWDLYHAQKAEAATLKTIRRRRSKGRSSSQKSAV
jgi:hydroxypyruvate isomerase